ncbi:carbohydrate kinase family protein [Gimesia maris]|uniref:carbohydrate kinase family protein n=1 Tax=Gimesia maris TaxID=122 RepID=UPI00241D2DE4|nr:carbohydrate kinase family protein [Gimesia maris]|tara:strand:+ start:273561 stop:274523 length:963 start_codon:yes stop_codon:yes gene_type:complete
MSSPSYDCLCAGIIVADHVCQAIDHLPRPGELVLTDQMELTIGGCASNVASDLARLDRQVAIAGIVGQDVFGCYVEERLIQSGVHCDYLMKSEELPTSGSFVINVQGEDRRFIHSVAANALFTGETVTREQIESSRILYLGGYCLSEELSPENVAEMFRMAKEAGVTTVLDVVTPKLADYWKMLESVLPLSDYFLPNNDEGELITGEADPLAQARAFRKAGAKNVIITCGGEGSILMNAEQTFQSEIYPVNLVDGTGSGDAFVAGFIHGLLEGASPEECLKFGSALGHSCVRATGATAGIFTRGELHDFVGAHDLQVRTI